MDIDQAWQHEINEESELQFLQAIEKIEFLAKHGRKDYLDSLSSQIKCKLFCLSQRPHP